MLSSPSRSSWKRCRTPEPEVPPALADKSLDAEISSEGQVRFQLAAQTA